MTKPKNTDALMKHLRNECNIEIHGSKQKKQLISYGYYHGYKGYRFLKRKALEFHLPILAKLLQ